MKNLIGLLTWALLITLLSGCKTEEKVLNISAAASLKDCMSEIEMLFAKKNPNVTILFNFGSSGSLQQQIEQGAPVDVFVSAGAKQMDGLESKNLLLSGSRSNLLSNSVVLVANLNVALNDFSDLESTQINKIAVGEPSSVPVGQYTEETLNYLDIREKIADKIVYAKDVREVLTWVETENAETGFVYKTDALISSKVKIIQEAPAGSHEPVTYPVAIIKATKNEKSAKQFTDLLKSDEAVKIFIKYGFEMVNQGERIVSE